MIARTRNKAIQFKPIQLRRSPDDQLVYWQTMAMQYQANMKYYQDYLNQIALLFGDEAFKNDDGTVSKTPVYPKIIELVKQKRSI